MVDKNYGRSNYLRSFLANSYGKVVEVFRHSLNVKFGNHYLHIGGDELGLTAFGISLPIDEVFRIIRNIEINDLVIYQDGQLRFYGRNVLKYDLKEFHETNLKISSHEVSKQSLELLFRTLQNMKIEQQIGLDTMDLKSLEPILLNFSKKNSDLLVQNLIGRGKGLTPSGDDMLVGILMTLTSIKGQKYNTQVLRESLMSPNFGNTTNVSKNYIQAIVDGYASEDLKILSENLNCNNEAVFERLISGILTMGHTSGHDTMMGIYLASMMVLEGEKDDK